MTRLDLESALTASCLVLLAGCAHGPPKELLDARAAYQQAASGITPTENPAQLHTAETALQNVEQAFEEDGDSEHTRDLAYVAMRAAQRAEVEAQVMKNERELAGLQAQRGRDEGRELDTLRGQSQAQQQQLSASEAARKDSDRRAAQAASDLARIASVKQEPRGMVITLSGEVLFTSGKAELLPAAQAKLSEVASALTRESPEATIVVEGHTDRQGGQALNLELSARRAEAVRDYLTAHGVAPDRIRAEGLGFSRPLGDNKTAEGRANNRRVEIVVRPAAGTPGT